MSHVRVHHPLFKGTIVGLVGIFCILGASGNAASTGVEGTPVFIAGSGDYHTYRIPAVVLSPNGTLLAFCEGRRNSASDTGEIDLLLKRSIDGGRTWSNQKVIATDRRNVFGNPAPVVDEDTRTIWLLMTWNLGADGEKEINNGTSKDTRRVYVTSSTDDGRTWANPREITEQVKKPGWRWYATGPVNGIQLTRGRHRGRLVIPANHTEVADDGKVETRSHIIYSDDHGLTWHLGGVEDKFTNESTVVELADGSLLHNMRCYRGNHRRAVATSHDGGDTWSPVASDEALVEPVCQASILRFTWPEGGQRSRILFSNPASLKREKMTVRISCDEGVTWPVSRLIHAGPAAYSCLVRLSDQTVGCLYECGDKNPYEKIVFARIALTWMEHPKEESAAMTQRIHVRASTIAGWNQLPSLPDDLGFAGAYAGVSGGALIVAGGANFPKGMPWEGGKKTWYDSVFVLPKPEAEWLTGFKLPRSLGYGVSVTTPEGVICAGGGNADGNFRDVFRLCWQNGRVETLTLPQLPRSMANGCGALVGQTLYVAGGLETPDATTAMNEFWALDLSVRRPAWRELESWPGPGRMLAVAGASQGAFFLFSGAELNAGADGKPARRYLTDAYCFKPGTGWKKLAELPRAAVAAPSPAPERQGELLIVSGDDGRLVDFEPKSQHPGFPKDVLAYDPAQDKWKRLANSPLSRASTPMVSWHHRAVIVNGEVHPGVRTPQVWEYTPN